MMKATILTTLLILTTLACTEESSDDTTMLLAAAAAVSQATSIPSECNVEPICSAFSNDGSQGGSVSVGIDGDTVYISTNSLAQHTMGPYGVNPNTAIAQSLAITIPLTPSVGPTDGNMGPMGIAYNGVYLFNASDGRPFSGCTGNAGYLETNHVDVYGGHPTGEGQYHYHGGQTLAYASELGISHNAGEHSSLLGYALDGYPIYGPYGYTDPTDSSSAIKLLSSCYATVASRTCCTDESVCGTSVVYDDKTLILGAFLEDYSHDATALSAGTCDLDEYNMRVQVTPEYPEGVRSYVISVDADGALQFPYTTSLNYYGNIVMEFSIGLGPPPP